MFQNHKILYFMIELAPLLDFLVSPSLTNLLCFMNFSLLLFFLFRLVRSSTPRAPPSPRPRGSLWTRPPPWTRWTAFCAPVSRTVSSLQFYPQLKEPVRVIPTQRYTTTVYRQMIFTLLLSDNNDKYIMLHLRGILQGNPRWIGFGLNGGPVKPVTNSHTTRAV